MYINIWYILATLLDQIKCRRYFLYVHTKSTYIHICKMLTFIKIVCIIYYKLKPTIHCFITNVCFFLIYEYVTCTQKI